MLIANLRVKLDFVAVAAMLVPCLQKFFPYEFMLFKVREHFP